MCAEACPLTGAQIALCRLVHRGPRPQVTLKPLQRELDLYVKKTRTKQKQRMEASCLELALEGERLCKVGDFKGGTAFFEAAVQVGTEDLKTLSAIYSQLGNAYFYLKEYSKALEYHRHDLTLARTIGDRIGEAKASGNLGNTLKVLGRYDEAVVCCQRHLDISQEQGDKVGEARALYNIGNVFHAKGKQQLWGCAQEPGDLPGDVRDTLQRATAFYEMNLSLVKELGDRAAQGRAFGNLGNTHYLLGNFVEAIKFHRERLSIAKEFGDKAAERRAYSNLGNALIFLSQFNSATEYYRKTLQLSRQLKDQVMEAQACYSLGNTYTLLQHLGNAYMSLGNHRQALHYAHKHLDISRENGDGHDVDGVSQRSKHQLSHSSGRKKYTETSEDRQWLDLPVDTDDITVQVTPQKLGRDPSDEDCFFDLLSKFQSSRMDDQRCRLGEDSNGQDARDDADADGDDGRRHASILASPQTEELFDLIASTQSRRLDDQRVSVGTLPGLRITHNNLGHLRTEAEPQEPSDDFFNMLIKCQSSRIDDQRCSPPEGGPRAPTVPDEDFFSLIQRVQAKRMDEQRVQLPSDNENATGDSS
ncbi:G-protein-signaling modulator 1 [Bagarius yarrelli]|uniref:G-protein-signaling modulator 1 n=1 Tax=Bagarius yarrelli TaxID=175774 RepID=A0A556TYF2_BAGYA|nr:G-protein-signaling modulator 1 [Bagarius yarrelli]